MNKLVSRTLRQRKIHSSLHLWKRFSTHLNLPILTLFTKDPCLLCDEAKEVLEPYKHREVDITLPENSVWYNRYKYDIPVFHLNGQFLMMHRVNTTILEKRLATIEKTTVK